MKSSPVPPKMPVPPTGAVSTPAQTVQAASAKVTTTSATPLSAAQVQLLRPDLRKRLQEQLRAAAAQGGGLSRAGALRLVVEAALLNEWGEQLQLDPAFAALVDRTCRSLEDGEGDADLLSRTLKELGS